MFTGNEELLYTYYWCGFSGITCGLLVAIKQLNPEFGFSILFLNIRAKVKKKKKRKITRINFNLFFKVFPSFVFAITTILSIFGFLHSSFPFILLGIFYSWLYLRFFQRKGEIVGDLNDTFAFSSFFPEILRFVFILQEILINFNSFFNF